MLFYTDFKFSGCKFIRASWQSKWEADMYYKLYSIKPTPLQVALRVQAYPSGKDNNIYYLNNYSHISTSWRLTRDDISEYILRNAPHTINQIFIYFIDFQPIYYC